MKNKNVALWTMCENRWKMLKIRIRLLGSRKRKVSEHSAVNTVLCITGLRSELNEIMKGFVWFGCRELFSIAQDILSKLSQSVYK